MKIMEATTCIFNFLGKYLLGVPFLLLLIVGLYVLAPAIYIAEAIMQNDHASIREYFRAWYIEFPEAVWDWIVEGF